MILLAGLKAIPQEPFEAAQIDGASKFKIFRHLTLPFLKLPIITALLFRIVDVMKTFDIIFSLTEGGPGIFTQVPSIYLYFIAWRRFYMGTASAVAWIFLVITIVTCMFFLRSLKFEEE